MLGLAVGAGAGFLGMVAARDSVTLDDAGVAVALALIVAPLAGAGAGAGIDASRTTREPIYARTTQDLAASQPRWGWAPVTLALPSGSALTVPGRVDVREYAERRRATRPNSGCTRQPRVT